MNDSNAELDVDDVDDISCDSIYHSIIDTPVNETLSPNLAPPHSPSSSSPKLSTFSVIELDSQLFKDQRSHERARQRLKKPDDISKAHRCVRCRYCRPEKWMGNAGRKQGNWALHTFVTEAAGDNRVDSDDILDSAEDIHGAVVAPISGTVTLVDLVKAPRKGSDKQFEIISRPRQVLALDDFTEVDPKPNLDDWEHIENEVKHHKAMLKVPSYAQVVASQPQWSWK